MRKIEAIAHRTDRLREFAVQQLSEATTIYGVLSPQA
jgi:hypothetical protein